MLFCSYKYSLIVGAYAFRMLTIRYIIVKVSVFKCECEMEVVCRLK